MTAFCFSGLTEDQTFALAELRGYRGEKPLYPLLQRLFSNHARQDPFLSRKAVPRGGFSPFSHTVLAIFSHFRKKVLLKNHAQRLTSTFKSVIMKAVRRADTKK